MTHSQAAALLANSQKYLMHLNVKGMKGKKYSKLLVWYKLILQNGQKLVELLEFERNDVRVLGMTFNVIKCGLFSENPDVTIMCSRCLNRLAAIIYDNEVEDGRWLVLEGEPVDRRNAKVFTVYSTSSSSSSVG